MTYRIVVERRAQKALVRLPKQDQGRIEAMIDALAEEPRPASCRPVRVAEKGTYRVRVGNYRVIYTVLDNEQAVIVARIARRSETTYQRLR